MAAIGRKSEWPAVFARLGELAIVKRRVGGYDGRGQWRLRAEEIDQLPDECYGECIVEQGIHFLGKCRWLARAPMMAAPCFTR